MGWVFFLIWFKSKEKWSRSLEIILAPLFSIKNTCWKGTFTGQFLSLHYLILPITSAAGKETKNYQREMLQSL